MDRETWLQLYKSQPDAVQDYLLDRLSSDQEAKAQAALSYDEDAWKRVMDTVWELLFNKTKQQAFQEQIKPLAGDRKPEDVEKALLLHVVLPLGDLVGWDVETRLQELGVPNNLIQSVPRVTLRPVSYGAAVRRIASAAKLSILAEETVRRVRELLISFLKGVRTMEQVQEMLQRSQAEGGVGFAKPQADAYVQAMQDFLSTTKILSENEYADWLMQERREEQSAAIAKPVAATEVQADGLPPAPPKQTGPLETSVALALQEIGPLTLDPYLMNRLQNAVSTRLRDVRNPMQTRSVLDRDAKVGGVGLPPEEAERIAGVIESVYARTRAQITEEEKAHIEAVTTEQKSKFEERRKRESAEHAQWYEEKVMATKKQDQARTQALMSLKQMSEAKTQGRGIDSSVSGNDNMPTMQDVRPPVHLVGLAEELEGMTLAEFRRMAKDPDQAAEKILQKLDTLQQESFEQWTEGVIAWRRSPLQQLYLKLVAESFASGKPVAQLAQEKRTTDPEMPSAEELGALIELNSHVQL